LLDPLPGHGDGIIAKDCLALIVSLPQADALATAQVDCRPDPHKRPMTPMKASTELMPPEYATDKNRPQVAEPINRPAFLVRPAHGPGGFVTGSVAEFVRILTLACGPSPRQPTSGGATFLGGRSCFPVYVYLPSCG
jgi:hypothetical protein